MNRTMADSDELLAGLDSIVEQIKVLVSAVDDLRCEIEWRARNHGNGEDRSLPNSTLNQLVESIATKGPSLPKQSTLLSTAGRLRAYEQALMSGRRGLWMNDWVDNEELDVQMPSGLVFSVSESVHGCAYMQWGVRLWLRPHIYPSHCR